ncbi:collagen alpha-1(I) chain-like [Eubalaena glacialis]|uniref:collagen alpha-1(I) chain-like n=1 Tax=Eubalaena glacialis TaxID=27606 RepID=UPI002A59A9B2|nr:collagen alpha-1(I) chain-like [Eubalaena glacialis]
MHGLIFETSICYWQDQPGRGKREHTEPGVPGRGARGAGDAAGPTPQSEEGGEADTGARPTAHTRDHEGARRAAAAARRGGTRRGPQPRRPESGAAGTGKSLGGRPARARSLALTRSRGRGRRGSGRGPDTPPSPPARRGAGRCGHGGRSTTAGRGPNNPRSGERAGAGRGGGTDGGPPSPNTQRRRRTGGGGGSRSGAAAGSGSETHRDTARGSADAADQAGGRTGERADEARLARPPSRRRNDDDVTEAVAGGGGRAPPRGGPGAVLRARTRWPPSRGSRPPPPNTHEPRPARENTLPRAHRPPRGPHTHLHRARLPASGTVSTPPGDAAGRGGRGGDTLTRARTARSQTEKGTRGWGRGRAGGDGEGAARTQGEGRGAEARGAAQGEEGPRHDQATRKTSAGSHRHTHEGGPTTPETPAGPSHPGASPRPGPAARARVRRSPPRATEGPVHPNSTHPSSPDPPSSKSDPQGLAPQGNAPERGDPHRAHTPPPAATRGEGRRDGLLVAAGLGSRDVRASPPPWAHHGGHRTRTHTRTRGPAPDAGLAGPSPDSEGGGAGRGRQRAAHGPTAGPAQALPRRRGALPTCSGSRHHGHCTLGRGSGWGVRYPKAPSRIAREGFLTEGASSPTHRLPFGPTEARHEPPSPRLGVGGSAHTRGRTTATRRHPAPTERATRDTPPRWGPKEHAGKKGTTPPLGLGHLRDNLERSRGTTDGQARHAHAPAGARSAAAERPPTDAGRTAREAHAKEAKRECLLRPRTTAPPTPRARHHHIDQSIQRARGQKAPKGRGTATVADDPVRRTPDTWHGACGVGSSQPPPGACGGGDRRRHRGPGQPGAHTRAGAQAQAGGSSGKGRFGRQTAVPSPEPCARPESQSPQRQTPGKTVSAPIWWQKRPISGENNHGAGQRGPSTNRRGDPRDLGPATCPQHFPIHTSPGALSGPSGRPEERGGKVGRGGRGGTTWERQRAGRGRPPRFARAVRYRSLRVSGRARTWLKKKKYPTRPPPTSGPHEGPRPGPGRPIRATQYGSGRSPPHPHPPRPGLAVEEGAGQGEKKSRPPTGTHVGTLKGRVLPPRPPARAGPGPSTSPDPGGLEHIFPGRRLPDDRSARGTAPGPVPVSPGHPLAAQAGPHLWSPTRKNIGQKESDHRDPRAPATEPVAPSTGLNARARAGPHLRSGALWGPGREGVGRGSGNERSKG